MASLWPNEGNKTTWRNIWAKKILKKNTLYHCFRISVIPSVLLSFLMDYCHSFRIIFIPSILVSFLPNIVIPFKLLSLPLQIFVILNSFCTLLYPKGEKIAWQSWPYLQVKIRMLTHKYFHPIVESIVFSVDLHHATHSIHIRTVSS